jgi:hypothetical protein
VGVIQLPQARPIRRWRIFLLFNTMQISFETPDDQDMGWLDALTWAKDELARLQGPRPPNIILVHAAVYRKIGESTHASPSLPPPSQN